MIFVSGAMTETARGEIPTIFNPHRIRAPPNLIVTNEIPRGNVPNGPFGRSLQHSDSGRLLLLSFVLTKLQTPPANMKRGPIRLSPSSPNHVLEYSSAV